jgi:hypothetical protein
MPVFATVVLKFGGAGRDRTADKGFADLCLTTWRPRRRNLPDNTITPLASVLGHRSIRRILSSGTAVGDPFESPKRTPPRSAKRQSYLLGRYLGYGDLLAARLTQNLDRQALKILFVGGDDDTFQTAGNF